MPCLPEPDGQHRVEHLPAQGGGTRAGLALLTDLKDQLGLGLVFISHDINTVRYVSDRIAVMYFGEIIETGPAARVFDHPEQDYTRTLLGATPSLLG